MSVCAASAARPGAHCGLLCDIRPRKVAVQRDTRTDDPAQRLPPRNAREHARKPTAGTSYAVPPKLYIRGQAGYNQTIYCTLGGCHVRF